MEHYNTKGEALLGAIFDSMDGDQIFLHNEKCNGTDDGCDPLVITVNGVASKMAVLDVFPPQLEQVE